MASGARLTTIRLPVQIGTSALWSLARSSAFFPGAVLVGLGVWLCWALRDLDQIGIGLGIATCISGGVLVYYAWRHGTLALAERPSDVLLDAKGLTIEGGGRHGLTLAWSDIDPDRCAIRDESEVRFVLWRVLVNIPLVILSVVGETDTTIEMGEKVAVKRLYVARRGTEELVLVAEADLKVEQASLAALSATIRSPRWYGGARELTAKLPTAVVCGRCGAPTAPTTAPEVRCVFCGEAVRIPEDLRARVGAAARLASTRQSGMAELEDLLASQPSASFANVTLLAAAMPIALAWPVTGGLIALNAAHSTLTPLRAVSLALLPLLLTFGAFLLARGRLTDRFALHAVVVGFGARDPARPGEPYQCRACRADLPDAAGSPVVHCVYCDQANVLGLDLRGEAHDAEEEHARLDSALAARAKERWLWRLGSLLSLVLLVGSLFVVRAALKEVPARRSSPRHASPRR